MNTKNDQLVQKHSILEGKMEAKHNRLVHEYVMMSRRLFREIEIRKKLIGTAIDLKLKSSAMVSPEFGNGQYRFMCEISSSVDRRMISLTRLPTATYSDRNVICITECVLCLGEITTEIVPYYLNSTMFSKIETDVTIPIIILSNNLISKYRKLDGIVKMEVYFDYDYITYKGLFC